MSTYTTYKCEIDGYEATQKIHMDEHLESKKYKQSEKIFRLELEKEKKLSLKEKYGTSNINKIIKKLRCKKVETLHDSEISDDTTYMSISSKEAMKDTIHEIHNFLRNNGAGYGMNALKLFTLFYGLAKIEVNGHFEKTGLSDVCKFSNIRKEFKKNKEIGMDYLHENIFSEIYENNKVNKMLVCEIPESATPYLIKELVFKVNNLIKKEQDMDFQLAGKIYEYFVGRDQSAISELGAYFTDRHITDYIYENIHSPILDDKGNVETMVDPFGGSGGFTLGYISYLKNKYQNINWTTDLSKIYHFDMNLDVVKYAMLEMYCLTGEFPQSEHLRTINSFKDDFKNQKGNMKFKNIFTNPPYGGDKITKSETTEKMELIKKHCEDFLKKKYKLKNMKQISNIKNIDSKDKAKLDQYDTIYKKLNEIKKENEAKTVSLLNSSPRFQLYAKQNKIDSSKCKDKEAVSFLMMMDLLEEGGTAVGVLKEGIFFDSKYKYLRQHCVENFKVEKVVSIDASQFENTSTKTSIIKFSNTGKTDQIEFYDLIIEKDDITEVQEQEDGTFEIVKIKGKITRVHDKLVSKATYQELVENEYTFNHKKYNKKKLIPGDGYKMVKLGDIVEFLPKSKRKASFGKEIGKYNFYTSSDKVKKCDEADYNEECLIIGTGGNSCIHYNKNKFSCSGDTILLKYNKNIEYNYFVFNCIWDYLLSQMNGSTIKHVTKNLLENFTIPIPTSDKKIKYWVDRINKPYNKIQECRDRLKELEDKVQEDIQTMLEENDTEEVELGVLCDINNKQIKRFNTSYGTKLKNKYRFYTGSANDIYYCNDFNIKDYVIILNKTNGSGKCNIFLDKKISCAKQTYICQSKNKEIETIYLYYFLRKNKLKLEEGYIGACHKNLDINFLNKFKITLPKDRKLIDSLNPLFSEIDNLNEELPKQETLYQQYLDELKAEAIKEEMEDLQLETKVIKKSKKENNKKTNSKMINL
ncbi:putative type I restriction modification enzyme, M and S domains [Cafeteria roenbergensis virus]|uniref:Putative type I restriction modification enzyme, M and S domains n=1 Tax=Cafeteria roenbergensis virus (strain BV-PW1) TaxID=693272 RepID=E3T5T6_CROVB|nr:putative type I restriction modification enzyme, M and S domains [Cafeteria roenbergensis virus BV-PW1]ADO67549.1 putative type I restriction modification enzyme, M and S domains [Cafeteria roenbergensis virus BV-PW1]